MTLEQSEQRLDRITNDLARIEGTLKKESMDISDHHDQAQKQRRVKKIQEAKSLLIKTRGEAQSRVSWIRW